MSLSSETMKGVYPQLTGPAWTLPRTSVISIRKWQTDFLSQSQMIEKVSSYFGKKNGNGLAMLPDPCLPIRAGLKSLRAEAESLSKLLLVSKMVVTKFNIKLMELRSEYTKRDYHLACMDGRLHVVKAKLEPGAPASTNYKLRAKKAIARLTPEQRQALLEELLE